MFVGWEGVGLSSYLLINFWFTRVQANKSAIKAMLMNRVGDFALLLAMFLIHLIFETFSYDVVFALSHRILNSTVLIGNFEFISLDLICILLFIGAMGKSAQIGLHTWLPDAMEGPTPVSALIHAATMVTAGVFLITRCSFLLEFSHLSLSIIVVIGALTAFFAATTGLFQNDIKKVIAYSTCSQLGYMVFACGLSNYNVGIFHLSNHAFFKALLFLGAGCIIHAVNDEQDMRKLGGLKALLPFSYSTMLIGSLALAGFPFLSGFYSKDVILELAYSKHSEVGQFCYSFGVLAAFCTSFYSVRLLYLVFLAEPNGTKLILCRAHEPSWKMSLPLVVLSIFSCIVGFTTKELFIGFGNNFWGSSVFILPTNHNLLDVEFINITYKLLPLVITFIGSIIAYVLYCYLPYFFYSLKKNIFFQLLYTFFNKKWYFDRLYAQFVSQIVLNKSYAFSYQTLDRGLTEQFGSYGLVNLIIRISNTLVNGQTNNITSSIVYLSISILLLLTGFITFKFQFLIVLIISFLFKLKN
jgi:NADH-ubiquinone oxidoreductase chain 5